MSQRTLIISHLCEKSEGIRIPLVPRVKTWNIDEDGRGAKVTGCAILTPYGHCLRGAPDPTGHHTDGASPGLFSHVSRGSIWLFSTL